MANLNASCASFSGGTSSGSTSSCLGLLYIVDSCPRLVSCTGGGGGLALGGSAFLLSTDHVKSLKLEPTLFLSPPPFAIADICATDLARPKVRDDVDDEEEEFDELVDIVEEAKDAELPPVRRSPTPCTVCTLRERGTRLLSFIVDLEFFKVAGSLSHMMARLLRERSRKRATCSIVERYMSRLASLCVWVHIKYVC